MNIRTLPHERPRVNPLKAAIAWSEAWTRLLGAMESAAGRAELDRAIARINIAKVKTNYFIWKFRAERGATR